MKKLSLILFLAGSLFMGATQLTALNFTEATPQEIYNREYWACMAICISPGNECHELCSKRAAAAATAVGFGVH
ncbi:MAG: hypothetical protein QNK37_14080 [Acidobacteriota bacterium]|nr:hypothetical protein [Acidobacteriota bacterium]